MRPQDIVILLKIIAIKDNNWKSKTISESLNISASEVSEALNRCQFAKLIDSKKQKVHTSAFKEFLIYGLKYVFPVKPGAIVRGMPTAHSAFPIKEHIAESKDVYVWAYAKGNARGQSIEPLYKTVPAIVENDKLFYELLAIVDTIRVGKAREVNIAIVELEKRINND